MDRDLATLRKHNCNHGLAHNHDVGTRTTDRVGDDRNRAMIRGSSAITDAPRIKEIEEKIFNHGLHGWARIIKLQ